MLEAGLDRCRSGHGDDRCDLGADPCHHLIAALDQQSHRCPRLPHGLGKIRPCGACEVLAAYLALIHALVRIRERLGRVDIGLDPPILFLSVSVYNQKVMIN